jgi:hypothetical protein
LWPICWDVTDDTQIVYDLEYLDAPVATGNLLYLWSIYVLYFAYIHSIGILLKCFSYILTSLRIGGTIRRHLLNNNHLEKIRSIASILPHQNPLYYPMCRVKHLEWKEAFQYSGENFTIVSTSSRKNHGITDYTMEYHSGRLSPSIVIDRLLKSIRQFEKEGLIIFSEVLEIEVRAQAIASDLRYRTNKTMGVLDGVPIAVKDMVHVKSHRVCNGKINCVLAHTDDLIVQRLRDAGLDYD